MSLQIVQQVHAAHPHLLQTNTFETAAHFCYYACGALGPEWHLLGKSGGESGYTWPNGVRTSHDAICRVVGGQKVATVDIIVGAAGPSPASPGWDAIPPHEWRASNTPVPISAVPAPSGGAPSTPSIPDGLWRAAHTEVLRRFPPQATPDAQFTRMVAEQFAHRFPAEGWGIKAADPSRPVSGDVIARRLPDGALVGFRVVPFSDPPQQFDLRGQHYIEVSPVDHLGLGAPSDPPADPPAPPPASPPPADLRAELAALRDEMRAIRDVQQAIAGALGAIHLALVDLGRTPDAPAALAMLIETTLRIEAIVRQPPTLRASTLLGTIVMRPEIPTHWPPMPAPKEPA